MRSQSHRKLLPIGLVLATVLPWPAPSRADDAQDLTAAMVQGIQLVKAGRYAEADEAAGRMSALAERVAVSRPMDAEAALLLLAAVDMPQGRFPEAIRLSEQAMAIAERSFPPDHEAVQVSLNALASLYTHQGRYARAEPYVRRLVDSAGRTRDANPLVYVSALSTLSDLYHFQGRLDEAEPLARQALDFEKATVGTGQPIYLVCVRKLAVICCARGRFAEAEPLAREALRLSRPPSTINWVGEMMVSANLSLLADAVLGLGRTAEGIELYTEAVAINEKFYVPGSPLLVRSQMKLIGLLYAAGRVDPAMDLVDRVLAALDRDKIDPANRSACYQYRYQERWKAGDRAGALEDLGRAMDLAEEVRASALGSEFDRARAFGQFGGVFETMVASRIVLANVAGAFAASERGRARSLQDQLELTGVDLLRGLPAAEADRLRRLDLEGRARITALQRQVESSGSAPGAPGTAAARPSAALQAELVRAQKDYLNIYRELRDASPAYHLAVARDRRPAGLEEVRRFVAREGALLLDYVVGQGSVSLIVIPPDGPARGLPLVATPDQARKLGIEPGLMTGPKLARAMAKVQQAGLFQRPRDDRESAAARDGLAALWELLIPASERKALTGGRLKRLMIVPDGPLALLPFEALVVRSGDDPRYLLDAGPPIAYAPAAGILMNLAGRPRAPIPADREPVLAIGDPAYPVPDANAGAILAQRSSTGSQYGARGGRLSRLPFSDQEARWVARVFDRDGIKAGTLTGPQATEAAVRHWSPGRRVLHLACHGVVDDAVGNVFGALALTPGPAAAIDPSDDGFLTMTELSELDLRACELTILSACRTNSGPNEVGEGVWALSRGFLVAGSRRVVASNWLVDDEAAASLVSYFCAGLAQAEKAGHPIDHAEALRAAKRWVRQQENWKSPYYWASMVLIGPP